MSKEKYQTRLASDDAERVEQYREKSNLSTSEAVRRLVRLGLEDHNSNKPREVSTTDQMLLSTASNLAAFAIIAALLAFTTSALPGEPMFSALAAGVVGGAAAALAMVMFVEFRYRPFRGLQKANTTGKSEVKN